MLIQSIRTTIRIQLEVAADFGISVLFNILLPIFAYGVLRD